MGSESLLQGFVFVFVFFGDNSTENHGHCIFGVSVETGQPL